MFGYIRLCAPEAKIKEYEYYRGVYCGLCRSMGKCTGVCSKLTLTYDFTFMALVRTAITGEKVCFEKKRCFAHPFARHPEAVRNGTLDISACASALLGYRKLKDDIADEKGTKKRKAILLLPFFAAFRRRAIGKVPGMEEKIASGLAALSETEKSRLASVDRPAELFGNILADILSYGLEDNEKRIAAMVGRSVGKWVYLVDALDDLEEDEKRGRFNPFLCVYGKAAIPSQIEDILTAELMETESALDLVEDEDKTRNAVLRNILYLGMPGVSREILKKKEGLVQ